MADTPGNKVHLLHRSGGKLQPEIQPIVLEYKKKKDEEDNGGESKGKEKYSKGLEDVQRLEGDVLRVSQKAAKAFSKSIDTYESERQKSAKEKTDGAVEDFVHNSAKAASTYMKEASDIPVDIAEAFDTDSYRKRLRESLRQASKVIGLWRL
jgi:hypothetical protein